MKFKRQWFHPGRRIEQVGKLGVHPFFTRSRDDSHGTRRGVIRRME